MGEKIKKTAESVFSTLNHLFVSKTGGSPAWEAGDTWATLDGEPQ